MKIEEFIENSLAKINASGYEQLKGKLVGEYLTFFFVEEKSISLDVLDNGLTTFETDRFYSSLCQQVEDMKTAINDNQILVKELGDTKLVEAYENYINSEVASSIQEALEQTEGAMDDEKIIDFCQETMKRMALIV